MTVTLPSIGQGRKKATFAEHHRKNSTGILPQISADDGGSQKQSAAGRRQSAKSVVGASTRDSADLSWGSGSPVSNEVSLVQKYLEEAPKDPKPEAYSFGMAAFMKAAMNGADNKEGSQSEDHGLDTDSQGSKLPVKRSSPKALNSISKNTDANAGEVSNVIRQSSGDGQALSERETVTQKARMLHDLLAACSDDAVRQYAEIKKNGSGARARARSALRIKRRKDIVNRLAPQTDERSSSKETSTSLSHFASETSNPIDATRRDALVARWVTLVSGVVQRCSANEADYNEEMSASKTSWASDKHHSIEEASPDGFALQGEDHVGSSVAPSPGTSSSSWRRRRVRIGSRDRQSPHDSRRRMSSDRRARSRRRQGRNLHRDADPDECLSLVQAAADANGQIATSPEMLSIQRSDQDACDHSQAEASAKIEPDPPPHPPRSSLLPPPSSSPSSTSSSLFLSSLLPPPSSLLPRFTGLTIVISETAPASRKDMYRETPIGSPKESELGRSPLKKRKGKKLNKALLKELSKKKQAHLACLSQLTNPLSTRKRFYQNMAESMGLNRDDLQTDYVYSTTIGELQSIASAKLAKMQADSAMKIQCAWRARMRRNLHCSMRMVALQARQKTVTLQRWWRHYLYLKKPLTTKVHCKRDMHRFAIRLQAAARGTQVREEYASTLTMRRVKRAAAAETKRIIHAALAKEIFRIIHMQACIRRFLARKRAEAKKQRQALELERLLAVESAAKAVAEEKAATQATLQQAIEERREVESKIEETSERKATQHHNRRNSTCAAIRGPVIDRSLQTPSQTPVAPSTRRPGNSRPLPQTKKYVSG